MANSVKQCQEQHRSSEVRYWPARNADGSLKRLADHSHVVDIICVDCYDVWLAEAQSDDPELAELVEHLNHVPEEL